MSLYGLIVFGILFGIALPEVVDDIVFSDAMMFRDASKPTT
jgi:hypothetical protein